MIFAPCQRGLCSSMSTCKMLRGSLFLSAEAAKMAELENEKSSSKERCERLQEQLEQAR